MTGFVYIVNLNNSPKFYIGSTDTITRRMYHHLTYLQAGSHLNMLLQKAWNESGSTDISVNHTEYPTIEEAYRVEQETIVRFCNDPNCCNISVDGDALYDHPDKNDIRQRTRQKQAETMGNLSSEERKERFAMTGDRNPNFGRSRTDETREKLRVSNVTGRKKVEEVDPVISDRMKGSGNPFFGKKHSEETRAKISAIKKAQETLPANRKQIVINGVEYASQAEAARALGVCNATITFRLKSTNPIYIDYKVVIRDEN